MTIKNITISLTIICFILFPDIVQAKILIQNGLTHEYDALPGEIQTGTIEISNVSDEEQSVQIYQRDYWYSYTGESRHDEPGTMDRSNADWININPTFITLQPNEISFIDYEIIIPQNNSLTGSYWSVIMIEGINPPDTSQNQTGLKINTVVRYAVQIITNIGDTGEKNMQFIQFNLSNLDSIKFLQIAFENIGERLLKPELGLEVFNIEGESQGIFKAERRKIYPGTSAMVELDLSSLPVGNYSGILIADCDEDYAFGTNMNLEIKDE